MQTARPPPRTETLDDHKLTCRRTPVDMQDRPYLSAGKQQQVGTALLHGTQDARAGDPFALRGDTERNPFGRRQVTSLQSDMSPNVRVTAGKR